MWDFLGVCTFGPYISGGRDLALSRASLRAKFGRVWPGFGFYRGQPGLLFDLYLVPGAASAACAVAVGVGVFLFFFSSSFLILLLLLSFLLYPRGCRHGTLRV